MKSNSKASKAGVGRGRRKVQQSRSGPAAQAEAAPLDDTQAAANLLAVMADPELLAKSTSEKLRHAGVSKADWLRFRKEPKFRRRITKACMAALDEHTGSVLEALAELALAPGRCGHQDRKLFLELVGQSRSAAAVEEEEEAEEENKPWSDVDMVDSMFRIHKGREHLLRYILPPGFRCVIGLDPDIPPDRVSYLQARSGFSPARCADYVAKVCESVARLPVNEQGDFLKRMEEYKVRQQSAGVDGLQSAESIHGGTVNEAY